MVVTMGLSLGVKRIDYSISIIIADYMVTM